MENNKTQYWKGLDELHRDESFEKQRHNEFAEKLPLNEALNDDAMGLTSNRRDFLKFMGFSISAATLAACHKTPIKKAVPYVVKPQEIEPGIANYYATTCFGCQSRCSLIVKTREGRPIKIEGNADSPFSRGGVCAVGQGTVLSLYDNSRLAKPLKDKKEVSWEELDKTVINQLKQGGNIRILTGTINSPSQLNAIKEFSAKYGAQHVSYDAVSSYALLEAHNQAFGKFAVPNYKIEDANIIVSFGADFLGTWISPVEYTKQYAAARKPENGKALQHIQFESTLSLSGSNADMRVVLKPSQYGEALVRLHNYIAAMGGGSQAGSSNLELMGNSIKHTAAALWKNKGKGIVITDSNNIDHQVIVASINNMLGNYGSTIDMANVSYQRTGNDKAMINLVKEMNAGQVNVLIVAGANPAYTYPDQNAFREGLKKVKLSVSLADRVDETAEGVHIIAPEHHFLESWTDAMPKEGYYSLVQPTITPIFATRSFQESLSAWMETPMNGYDYLRNFVQQNIFSKVGGGNFDDFWTKSLHDGFVTGAGGLNITTNTASSANVNVADAAGRASKKGTDAVEVVLYEKVAIRDGKEANNPWLQELPDPVSKVSWDNYAAVSPKWADEKGLTDEDVIEIKAGNHTVSLPVLRQPGQRYGTIAIAFGYGRKVGKDAGKVINEVGGANAFPFTSISGDTFIYGGQTIEVSGKKGTYPLALTQTHHHIEGRDLVMETTVAELPNYDAKGSLQINKGKKGGAHHVSLWKDYRYPGHAWGMVIDLNACTGCNACVVSCTAENNVPVVGKDEVRRRREMHWLRLDRYYAVADTEGAYHNKYKEIDALTEEKKSDYENVKVVFQPMLCQHCNNAPCETVCPVAATTHSSEGLNQMTYNRCVGTRYCANNCPYKVRRFNWFNYAQNDNFDYNMNNTLGRMVLNPDVTVRMRGVMEKCSFCVQRIQLSKLNAKKEGRPMKDGDVKTACQQTCPANAIVFGDMNDPNSEISKLLENKRTYNILTELNVRPNVSYMARVRNTSDLPNA